MTKIEKILINMIDYAEEIAQDGYKPTNIDEEAVIKLERLLQTIKTRITQKGGKQ